ncbi:hypothetical protein BJX63DRAFT_434121 [Aspergillus granulosus]|uniref:Uncharacterized protein n=1 Tax=Aspergillus granulosus TaxID=176169 RepID=A0ABR4H576_9EURO
MVSLKHISLIFQILATVVPSASWSTSAYATVTVSRTTSTGYSPVFPTASLTVEPISTITTVNLETFGTGYYFGYKPVANVTTEILVLPNNTDLPVTELYRWGQSASYDQKSIVTHYYMPYVVTNLPECTLTEYTYTDSVSVSIPERLMAQATNESLVAFKTTYVYDRSTNLGGQVYTSSKCDVYLNSNAFPADQQTEATFADEWLTECVDPRSYSCSDGENTAATGSGGCRGEYPPTSTPASTPASTTEATDDSPEPTGGAASWGVSWRLGYGLALTCGLIVL